LNSGAVKLKNTILFGSLLLAIFGIVSSIGLILISSYLNNAAQSIKEVVDSIVVSEELQIDLLEHNREQLLFNYTGENNHAFRRDQAAMRMKQGTESIALYVNSSAERVLVAEIQDHIARYLAMPDDMEKDQDAIQEYMSAASTLNEVTVRLRKLILLNQEQAQTANERVARQDMMADALGYGIIAALLTALLILGLGARSVIYRPLISLREVVKRYGKGDFSVRAEQNGPQELREIAIVFNEMANNLENSHQNQHRFLAAIAHDLRNPIGAIKMSMDLIATTRPEAYEEILEITDIVRRQSDQLDQMVGDLLDRTRIEAGELALKLEDYDLRKAASLAVRLYQSTSKIHRLQLQLPTNPVVCRCDPTRIAQVLNNLLSNAIKYSPYGGTITVEVASMNMSAAISVSDQGMGISPEDHERIFEPFKRSKSTRETIPGVGLGLSVSRRLVEVHGGRIDITSESGRGSTFTVKLPTSETTHGLDA